MSQPADHRSYERRAVVVEASAWSLVQATQLVSGTTVDIGEGGVLLRLPGLSEAAVRLELRLAFPGRPLVVNVSVVRRQAPDLVAVVFDVLAPEDLQRVLEFVRATP
jgi:hypothetical protein